MKEVFSHMQTIRCLTIFSFELDQFQFSYEENVCIKMLTYLSEHKDVIDNKSKLHKPFFALFGSLAIYCPAGSLELSWVQLSQQVDGPAEIGLFGQVGSIGSLSRLLPELLKSRTTKLLGIFINFRMTNYS